MKNNSFRILAAVSIVLGIFSFAGENLKVENFSLQDYNGKAHALSDYTSSKAIVLMFISIQCPVSNGYNERMVQLYNNYSSKGITFLGINANKAESVEDIKDHAKEHGFTFTVLKDKNNVVADKLAASVTPEIFVLDSKFNVLYHGRIDDSRRISDVKTKDLQWALDAILAGKPVAVQETKAFGCSIKRMP